MNEWISTIKSLPMPRAVVRIKYVTKSGRIYETDAWYDGQGIFNFVGSKRYEELENVMYWKPILT